MMNQPTYTPRPRTPTYVAPAYTPSYQPAAVAAAAPRCPPPTVTTLPESHDPGQNRIWIKVSSNCAHTVKIVVHQVNFYPSLTPSRVERTYTMDIGSSADLYCDGKREGCVIQMLGSRGS